MKVAILVLALAAFVHADIYLHNPRLVRVFTVISAISSDSCELMCDVFPPFLYPTGARTIAWTRPEETETTQTGTWFFLLPQNTNLLGYNNNTKNAKSCSICYIYVVFFALDFLTPRTTIVVDTMWVASTTTRVRFSPSSGPISTRVVTRTTTVNKFCSTCVGTKSVMEPPPSEWEMVDRIKYT